MSDKFIWYKNKVAGPYPQFPNDKDVDLWKTMIDSGEMDATMPDTPPLNEDMENYPDEAHIICYQEDLKK